MSKTGQIRETTRNKVRKEYDSKIKFWKTSVQESDERVKYLFRENLKLKEQLESLREENIRLVDILDKTTGLSKEELLEKFRNDEILTNLMKSISDYIL